MNRPRALAPSLLSGAAGLALVAGMAFAAPAAAQQQNADPLDNAEQAMSPPPIISDDDRADAAPPSEVRDDFRWDELDADGDGRISRSEGSANPDFDSNFEMTDADGDGYVTRAEEDASDRANPPEPEEADEQQ
ncbi:hypothetical protein [Novilysobacter antarcticus]|uniref:hypothetical protein n=1 Tax=Novilysobacter antarcticus TaxID=2862543 RepID=UPI001C990DD5|nr:hypothetical protein [Lysobacter antarcticus]